MEDWRKGFQQPQDEYTPVPFWFWNDDLEPVHLLWQLEEMWDKGIAACILHARKGMTVPYLSEEWFNRVGLVLDKAADLGMKIWLYDEENWPSGYAGGRLLEQDPSLAAKCLSTEKLYPVLGVPIVIRDVPDTRLVAVVAVYQDREFVDLTDYKTGTCRAWAAETLCWEVFVFREELCTHTPAYFDNPYVDLLNKKTAELFVKMTHGEYKRRFSQHWGTTIRGFFTDEPGFYQNYLEQARNLNTIAWTPAFPLVFREKKGYDLIPYLCTLWQDMGDVSRRVRHDYYDVLTMLYRDSYFKVIRDFLEPDGLCSMGHLHHEETLGDTVQMEGHFFEAMRYLSVPGIDRIDRDKVRVTEKLGSSAAHLYGRERCFSESYGCYGWTLTPEEMKAEADWQFVQGINLLVPHAFFSSIEGVRSAESPPSEFYQNPYWQYYRIFAEYIARLGYLLTRGKPVCTALVYYPITSCWERYTPLRHADVEKVDNSFRRLSQYLLERQLDFDYADDAALTERAEITAEGLCIQGAMYATVVIPPLWNIPLHTLEQLTIFAEKGGFVVSVGELPARGIEAAEDTAVASLLKRLHDCQTYQPISDWGNGETEALGSFFVKNEKQDVWLEEPDAGIKYLHRHAEGQDVYFLVNENACPAEHRVHFRCTGIAEEWNAETGEIQPVVGTAYRGITTLSVSLTGFGSRLVVFHTGRRELTGNWQLDIENQHFETVLTDWVQLGMAQYSGSAQYSKNFWWTSEQGRRLWIDLGDVRDCAEIRLNGHLVATRLWRPYKADITGYVQQGENQLELVISNTLANALVNAQIPAGLLGPVTLYESPL